MTINRNKIQVSGKHYVSNKIIIQTIFDDFKTLISELKLNEITKEFIYRLNLLCIFVDSLL